MANRRLSTSLLSAVSVWCVLMLTATGQETLGPPEQGSGDTTTQTLPPTPQTAATTTKPMVQTGLTTLQLIFQTSLPRQPDATSTKIVTSPTSTSTTATAITMHQQVMTEQGSGDTTTQTLPPTPQTAATTTKPTVKTGLTTLQVIFQTSLSRQPDATSTKIVTSPTSTSTTATAITVHQQIMTGNALAIGVGAGVGGVLLVLVIVIILIVLIRGRTGGGHESEVAGGKSTSISIRSKFSSLQARDNYDLVVLSNYSTVNEEEKGRRPFKKALSSQPALEMVESTFSPGSQETRSGSGGDKFATTILYHDIGPASVEKNTPYYSAMTKVRGTSSTETTSNPSALMGAAAYEEMAPIGKKEEQNTSQVAASVSPALVGAYVYEEMAPLGKKEEQNAVDAAVSPAIMGASMYEEMAPLGMKEKHDASQVAVSVSPALVGAYVYEEMAPLGKEEQNAIDAAVSSALMGASLYEEMAQLGKKEEQDTSQVAAPTFTNMYQQLGPAGATEQHQSITPAQAERVPTESMTSPKHTSMDKEAAPASKIEQYETLIPDVQRKNMKNMTPNSTPMPANTTSVYQTVGDGSQKEQYQSPTSDVRRSVKDSASSSIPTASALGQDVNVLNKQGRYRSRGASGRLPRPTQSKQVSGQAQRSKLTQDTRDVRTVSLSSATNQPPNRGSNASPANAGSAVYQALGTENLYESTTVPKPSNTMQEVGLAAEPTGDYQAILAAYVQTSEYEQPRKHEKSPS
ncbi:uncharacterized protein LOC135831034 isoform X2 [Sycon ciliatum]|uniref:uncharacterized protein LOC135831034 isoform X2 n=1 Tax=Sycon ciliatum TaxID=27933 RepID=UPI0031F71B60